jgi:O-antigen ligase
MLIKKLDYLTEFFLWTLLFGITFSNAVVEISIGCIILIFLIKRFILKKVSPPNTPINLLLLIFFIIIFITFLRSAYFKESLRGLLRVPKYILLYFSIVEFLCKNEERLKRIFWVFIIIGGFTFLNGIFQSIFGFDILRHRTIDRFDYLHRISASFVHPNDFGAYLISILPLYLSFFSPSFSKRKKLILICISALGFYCLLRTASRGAWLGFIIGMIVYFFYYKKKISLVIPFVILAFILCSPNGFNRIVGLFKIEKNTVWERIQLWKGTWNMVKIHPFLGFGINTFSDYFPKYKPASYPDVRYTHNSYLQMWSEIGIFGLLTFLSIVLCILYKAKRRIKLKLKEPQGFPLLGLIVGYLSFLIHSGLDTNLYSLVLTTHFWVLTAYIVSLNKTIENKLCLRDTC